MNPADLETHELLRFHKFIGSLVCDRMGHEWEEVEINRQARALNVQPIEKCRQCGDTRTRSLTLSMSGGGDLSGMSTTLEGSD